MGKALAVDFSAGNERVKFTWKVSADPRIYRSIFYWNDGKDSAVIPVQSTDMETVISVKEGIYAFKLVNKDDENHKSLAVEKSVQVYGPTYISRLSNRNLSISSDDDGLFTINWVTIENAAIQYATVKYTDYSTGNAVPKSIHVENEDDETLLEGAREGDIFIVSTSYLPDGALDILDALPVEYTLR
jgi:hypothetical protein